VCPKYSQRSYKLEITKEKNVFSSTKRVFLKKCRKEEEYTLKYCTFKEWLTNKHW
jgi:hypothetical protein